MGAAGGSRIGQKAGGVGKGKLGLLAGLGAGGLALAKRKNLFGGSKEEPAPAAEFAAPATPVATDTSVPRQSTAA